MPENVDYPLKPYLVSSERLLHPYLVLKYKLCVKLLQCYIDADSLIDFLDLVMTCITFLTAVIINNVPVKIKSVHFSSICV